MVPAFPAISKLYLRSWSHAMKYSFMGFHFHLFNTDVLINIYVVYHKNKSRSFYRSAENVRYGCLSRPLVPMFWTLCATINGFISSVFTKVAEPVLRNRCLRQHSIISANKQICSDFTWQQKWCKNHHERFNFLIVVHWTNLTCPWDAVIH